MKYNHKGRTVEEATGVKTGEMPERVTGLIARLANERKNKERVPKSVIMEAFEKEFTPRELAYLFSMCLRVPALGYPEADISKEDVEDRYEDDKPEEDFGDFLTKDNK